MATERMRQMQAQMQDMQQKAHSAQNTTTDSKPPRMKEGDYIEYEEVK